MAWDLGRLRIRRVIVHEVPTRRAGGEGSPPILSEIESPINQDLKNYFRERITTSLDAAAFAAIFDPTSTSPVPKLVTDDLLGARNSNFVARSQEMARHLHASQTAVNPTGLLTVADGTVEDHRCLAILKLEREEGVQLKQTRHDGMATFDIQHIHDLMLTEKTRVFKAGLFVREGETTASIEGLVSDKQRGYQPTTEVADFFLRRFLGCKLRDDPQVLTKKYFEATEAFINEEVKDPVAKARYQVGLLADLGSQENQLDPREFARRVLAPADRQRYVAYMAQAEIPAAAFPKEVALVESRVRRMQMDLESGLAILGPPEVFNERVRLTDLEDGRTRLEIEDRVKRVQGRR